MIPKESLEAPLILAWRLFIAWQARKAPEAPFGIRDDPQADCSAGKAGQARFQEPRR